MGFPRDGTTPERPSLQHGVVTRAGRRLVPAGGGLLPRRRANPKTGAAEFDGSMGVECFVALDVGWVARKYVKTATPEGIPP